MTEIKEFADGEMANDPFFKAHRGGSGNVILCIIEKLDGSEEFGIFSDIEQAEAWADGFDEDEAEAALFVPYVVNAPEWGNVTEH